MFRKDVLMEDKQMRKYNHKVSKRVNESLNKREAVVRRQKRVLAVCIIVIVSLGILLGTGINALASSKADVASYNKYYKSVRIEAGDTLWTIADEYIADFNIDKEDYIAELCELNQICIEDTIHAGDYLVIAYYSQEVK